jgi:hypothetical protein
MLVQESTHVFRIEQVGNAQNQRNRLFIALKRPLLLQDSRSLMATHAPQDFMVIERGSRKCS